MPPQIDTETLFSLLVGLVFSALLWHWRKRWQRRARAKDHHAAASREAVIPEICVGCRSPHAPHALTVGTFFVGISPFAQLLDARFKRAFTFRCCLRCVRPVRRRRHAGIFVAAVGVFLVVACFAFIALLQFSSAFLGWFLSHTRPFITAHGLNPILQLYLLMILFVLGFVLSGAGLWMRAYSPFVHILDGGGDEIYFHFRSQLFRDQFAQLNGET